MVRLIVCRLSHAGMVFARLVSRISSPSMFMFVVLCLQNIMRPSTELSEEVVRKSIGGVDDFLRTEGDESTAAQDVVSHAKEEFRHRLSRYSPR